MLLSVVIAALLGSSIYLAVTSLPYLAFSPTSDSTYGALNACLLQHVPERLGFAVSKDARRAIAWSSARAVECTRADQHATPTVLELKAVTHAAYSVDGSLWVSTSGAEAGVFRVAPTPVRMGTLEAQALVGTDKGVVVLEPTGRLSSLDASGAVTGTIDGPPPHGASLTASGDGLRVVLRLGARLIAYDSQRLTRLVDQVPCPLERAWWVKGKHVDEAMTIKNTQIAQELALPPVKIHCSVLAEDAIKAAVADYKAKHGSEAKAG